MKEILDDDLVMENNPPLSEDAYIDIKLKIQELEKTDWHGLAIIWMVMGFIALNALLQGGVFGFSLFLIIKLIAVVAHIMLLVLWQQNKVAAYVGGISVYLLFNGVLFGVLSFGSIIWALVFIAGYVKVIDREWTLKQLKSRIG